MSSYRRTPLPAGTGIGGRNLPIFLLPPEGFSIAPVTPQGFTVKAQATSETAGEKAQATPPDAIMSTPHSAPPDLPSDQDVASAKAQAAPASRTSPAKAQATLDLGLQATKIEQEQSPEGHEGATTADTRPPPPAIPAREMATAVTIRPPPPAIPGAT